IISRRAVCLYYDVLTLGITQLAQPRSGLLEVGRDLDSRERHGTPARSAPPAAGLRGRPQCAAHAPQPERLPWSGFLARACSIRPRPIVRKGATVQTCEIVRS